MFRCKKAISLQLWTVPWVCRRSRLVEVIDSRHMKVAKLTALLPGRLYRQGGTPATHFC